MSFFEDLKNTEITDSAFYLAFVLALTAPGTAYALYFHFEIFKELDSWKAFFMVVSMSTPILIVSTFATAAANVNYFIDHEGLKVLAFYSCVAALMSSYIGLLVAALEGWKFLFSVVVTAALTLAVAFFLGLSSRLE